MDVDIAQQLHQGHIARRSKSGERIGHLCQGSPSPNPYNRLRLEQRINKRGRYPADQMSNFVWLSRRWLCRDHHSVLQLVAQTKLLLQPGMAALGTNDLDAHDPFFACTAQQPRDRAARNIAQLRNLCLRQLFQVVFFGNLHHQIQIVDRILFS